MIRVVDEPFGVYAGAEYEEEFWGFVHATMKAINPKKNPHQNQFSSIWNNSVCSETPDNAPNSYA